MSIYKRLCEQAMVCIEKHRLQIEKLSFSQTTAQCLIRGDDAESALGVALLPEEIQGCREVPLKDARAILEHSMGYDLLLRSQGLSIINAVGQWLLKREQQALTLHQDIRTLVTQSVLDATEHTSNIVFIGHLAPVVAKVVQKRPNTNVFCRRKEQFGRHVFSDIFEYEAVQDADALIITGAALVGSTVDALLAMAPKATFKACVGFSAGAYPQWLSQSSLTHMISLWYENGALYDALSDNGFHDALFDERAYSFIF